MMMCLIRCAVWLWLLASFSLFAETIRIRGSQSEFDSTHDYYVGLIKLAYEKQKAQLEIKFAPYMVQDRALSELQAGRLIDLYWAGTNQKRETELGFIPIPLTKGLLGYRVFTIHQKNLPILMKVNTLNELKEVRLCQGLHWPDTDIMLAAGLSILPNVVYENMFKQVYSDRCHAFPRGINEAFSEVESRKQLMPNLIVYDKLILHYPFPMYFFTHKDNAQLIQTLTKGLTLAIEDGSFDRYMQEHSATRHLFPLTKWQQSKIIEIPNPFLSADTDIKNRLLWINIGQQ